jgi:hypothetical protein
MINQSKLKQDAADFDLTEFARTTINLETEIDIDNINIPITSQSKIFKEHNNIIQSSPPLPQSQCLSESQLKPINKTIVIDSNKILDKTIVLTTQNENKNKNENENKNKNESVNKSEIKIKLDTEINHEIKDNIIITEEEEYKEYKEDKGTSYIEQILSEKFENQFNPSESILEDLGDYEYISSTKKREYNVKCKNGNNFNSNDIKEIYKYLVKYRNKIKKKLLNKNLIKGDQSYSDKLLFSLYLNLLFDDIYIS